MSDKDRVKDVLSRMTLEEKIGQMQQVDGGGDSLHPDLIADVRAGRVGSVLNLVDVNLRNELQRIAVEESRLGIPLLFARDVIHGFQTVAPIPLGQGASWNAELIEQLARVAAIEAYNAGVDWTFAPMIDVSRDARWGRIAESFGEDPYLNGLFGAAMIRGFQGDDLSKPGTIAACAKHFAGYGASESGRDYNTTNIPTNELRNIYLPPFLAAVEAGVASVMSSFGDIDGIPATANEFLMRKVLRDEFGFDGVMIADWDAVRQLSDHGLTDGDREAAKVASNAGIDIEMAGSAYRDHLNELVETGEVSSSVVDEATRNILEMKAKLGVFEEPYRLVSHKVTEDRVAVTDLHLKGAEESVVVLKNSDDFLPLSSKDLTSVCVVGPMADQPYEQLGTWIFDGDTSRSVTPLQALRDMLHGDVDVRFEPGLNFSRDTDGARFETASAVAGASDVILAFVGEEAILSGEAHSRANIDLPGKQIELIETLAATGKPVVLVVIAGRPLTLAPVLDKVSAVMFALHPGTQTGPALANLIFGVVDPVGRLPFSMPKAVGQLPLYYNQKNTGRPAQPEHFIALSEVQVGAPQTSLGMSSFHMDVGFGPEFPFGFGLSYSHCAMTSAAIDAQQIGPGKPLHVTAQLKNSGDRKAIETVQLYIRDVAASITRPVKELKQFKRVEVAPHSASSVSFEITEKDLAFWTRDGVRRVEAGRFHVFVGLNSEAGHLLEFEWVDSH